MYEMHMRSMVNFFQDQFLVPLFDKMNILSVIIAIDMGTNRFYLKI